MFVWFAYKSYDMNTEKECNEMKQTTTVGVQYSCIVIFSSGSSIEEVLGYERRYFIMVAYNISRGVVYNIKHIHFCFMTLKLYFYRPTTTQQPNR